MTVVLLKTGDQVTDEKPHEDTGRKWLPTSRKENLRRSQSYQGWILTPDFWSPKL